MRKSDLSGHTLMELLVVLVLISLAATAIFLSYINFTREMTVESVSTELQTEENLGLEILRLDLEHAGYGLAENIPYHPGGNDNLDMPVEYDGSKLTIRSTLNNTRMATINWFIVQCPGWTILAKGKQEDTLGLKLVLLDKYKNFVENVNFGTCPNVGPDIYIGFPYPRDATNGCKLQFCNRITYRLSSSQNLGHCHPGTRNLLRAVGDGQGEPVLSCVADFKATFGILQNDDTVTEETDLSSLAQVNELKKKLKWIRVYLLVQEGGLDPSYKFDDQPIRDFNNSHKISLTLPSDYDHYRWRIMQLTVIPASLTGF